MPNYCTNIVRAPKEVLDDLFDKGKITFEKLIPMPKALNITESTTIDNAIAYAMNKKEPDEFLKLKMMLESTKDDYYGNLWDKYKRKFTIEKIKEIEKSAQRYIPDETERKLGIKTLEQFGNLCLGQRLYLDSGHWADRRFLRSFSYRSEEHTSELQSPVWISYSGLCM